MDIAQFLLPFGRLFLLIGVGVLLARIGIVNQSGADQLSALLINVSMPALVFMAVASDLTMDMVRSAPWAMALIVILGGILWGGMMLLFRRAKPGTRGVLAMASGCCNTGSLGIPVLGSLLGPAAAVIAALADMGTNINLYAWGVTGLQSSGKSNPFKQLWDLVRHPLFLGLVLGAIWFATGIPLPEPIAGATQMVADTTAPLSMLLLGFLLYDRAKAGLRLSKLVLAVAAVRFVISPLVMLGVTALIPLDPQTRAICIIQAAMPSAMLSPVLARQFRADVELALSCTVITTAMALVTLPLTSYFVLRLLGS